MRSGADCRPAGRHTRAEALKLAREEKQKSTTPYTPNALERGMHIAEGRADAVARAPDGVHLKLGSLTTGSGFAYGAGYRNRRLFDREGAACGVGRPPRSRDTGRSRRGSTCRISPTAG